MRITRNLHLNSANSLCTKGKFTFLNLINLYSHQTSPLLLSTQKHLFDEMKPTEGYLYRVGGGMDGWNQVKHSIVNQKLITMHQPKFAVSSTRNLELLHKSFVQEKEMIFHRISYRMRSCVMPKWLGMWQVSNWMICYQSYSQFHPIPKV